MNPAEDKELAAAMAEVQHALTTVQQLLVRRGGDPTGILSQWLRTSGQLAGRPEGTIEEMRKLAEANTATLQGLLARMQQGRSPGVTPFQESAQAPSEAPPAAPSVAPPATPARTSREARQEHLVSTPIVPPRGSNMPLTGLTGGSTTLPPDPSALGGLTTGVTTEPPTEPPTGRTTTRHSQVHPGADGWSANELTWRWPSFTPSEFACHCCGERGRISVRLLDILQRLRDRFGPVRINSGYRCATNNAKVAGSPRSLHLRGRAADCAIRGVGGPEAGGWLDTQYPDTLGIGIADGWLHIDDREIRARWTYPREAT